MTIWQGIFEENPGSEKELIILPQLPEKVRDDYLVKAFFGQNELEWLRNMELSGLLILKEIRDNFVYYWYLPSKNSEPITFYIFFGDEVDAIKDITHKLFYSYHELTQAMRLVFFHKKDNLITNISCVEFINCRGEYEALIVSEIDHGKKELSVDLEDIPKGSSSGERRRNMEDTLYNAVRQQNLVKSVAEPQGNKSKTADKTKYPVKALKEYLEDKHKTVAKTQDFAESLKELLKAYVNYSLVVKGADQNEVELRPVEDENLQRTHDEIHEAMRPSILKELFLRKLQEDVFLDFSRSFPEVGSQLEVVGKPSDRLGTIYHSDTPTKIVQILVKEGVEGLLLSSWNSFIRDKTWHLNIYRNAELLLYTGHTFYVLTYPRNNDTIDFPSDFQHLMTQTLILSLTAFKIFLQMQVIPFLLRNQNISISENDYLKTYDSVKVLLLVRTDSSDIFENELAEIKEGSKLQRLIQFSDLEALQKLVIVFQTEYDDCIQLYQFNSDRKIVKLHKRFRDLFAPDFNHLNKDSQYYQLVRNVAAVVVKNYTEELKIKITDTRTILAPAFDSHKTIARSLLATGKINQWERLYKTCVDAEEKIEFILETLGFFRSPAYQDHSTFQCVADCVNKDMNNLPSAKLFGKFILKYNFHRCGIFQLLKTTVHQKYLKKISAESVEFSNPFLNKLAFEAIEANKAFVI